MLRAALRNFVVQGLSLGQSFFDRIFVVALLLRSLCVDVYADWVAITSVAGLFGLAETGLNFYFGNVMMRRFAEGDVAGFQRILSVAITVAVGLAAFLVLLGVALIAPIDIVRSLSLGGIARFDAKIALALLSIVSISRIFRGCLFQIYRGRREFARGLIVDLMFAMSVSLASAGVALVGGGVVDLALATFGCEAIFGWGVLLVDLTRRYPSLRLRPAFPRAAEIADLWARIKWSALAQAGSSLVVWAPPLLLGAMRIGASAVVSFVVLRILVSLGRQATGMLLTAFNVELAALAPETQGDSRAAAIAGLGAFSSAATAVLAVASVAFAGEAISLWTGKAALFDPAVLASLFAGSLAGGFAAPFQMFLSFANEPKLVAIAAVINACVGLTLGALGASMFGLLGLTVGLAMGEIAGSAYFLTSGALSALRLDTAHYLRRSFAITSLVVVSTAALAVALRLLPLPGGLAGLTVRVILFVVLGATPALVFSAPRPLRLQILSRLRRSADMRVSQK